MAVTKIIWSLETILTKYIRFERVNVLPCSPILLRLFFPSFEQSLAFLVISSPSRLSRDRGIV